MTLSFPLPQNIHGDNLLAEIQAAGVNATRVVVMGENVVVRVPEGTDPAVVEAVVAAHTGALTPEQQAEKDADAEADAQSAQIETILAKCRAVANGTDTFTNAEAQRLLARLTIMVARRLRSA